MSISFRCAGMWLCAGALLGLSTIAFASPNGPECQVQSGENFKAKMCLYRGQQMQHDHYSLIVDDTLIFSLVDDFSEDVHIKHTIPPGLTIELPLSKAAGDKVVEISGGCVPESKDGMEVARICNFTFGKTKVVNNVRFEF